MSAGFTTAAASQAWTNSVHADLSLTGTERALKGCLKSCFSSEAGDYYRPGFVRSEDLEKTHSKFPSHGSKRNLSSPQTRNSRENVRFSRSFQQSVNKSSPPECSLWTSSKRERSECPGSAFSIIRKSGNTPLAWDYKPVVQTTGNTRIVREIPQLLDAQAAPLLAEQEVLRHLPKTYILTCEHDVLRDDGIMYAKRLESAGVEVTLDHFEDGFHGCMIFTSWPTNFSVGIRTRNSYIKWLDQNL
ncbi:hypothetical protein PANDA_008614 [Ailuropoda melanoleuca]|uniref:Alpha/beta hydrolase fold-3 domain-containing protein n=1 Tax=Ailuropoda melanoleuca TaxID=9646 RepID=D2HD74_AILME|nr:hypothetical protein PANDA_008614 [Ailuropoda melanoleuca]